MAHRLQRTIFDIMLRERPLNDWELVLFLIQRKFRGIPRVVCICDNAYWILKIPKDLLDALPPLSRVIQIKNKLSNKKVRQEPLIFL